MRVHSTTEEKIIHKKLTDSERNAEQVVSDMRSNESHPLLFHPHSAMFAWTLTLPWASRWFSVLGGGFLRSTSSRAWWSPSRAATRTAALVLPPW